MIGLLLAAAVAASPIDTILATRQALLSDLAKRPDAPVVLKETGVDAVDLEIRKLADGKRVVWQGTKTLEAKAPDGVSPAVHPVSRISGADFGVHDWWLCRLADKRREVAALKDGQVDLVMLGDSITHFWEAQGKDALAELRKTYTILDLGYRGDRTGHLLWRVLNGELDGYKAKCITLMIGTNNCGFTPADETAAAIREILAVIARKQPQAKVLLMPVFPRGASANDGGRLVNDKVNELIRPCADDRRVIWFDVGSRFIDAKGDVAKYMLPDRLHLNAEGYRLWLEALYGELK